MTRREYIQLIQRQIYGGMPTDDAVITTGLVNLWLNAGIAAAVKQNWTEAIQLEGIGYINNGFYSTFTGITITADGSDNFLYSAVLPHVPYGLGRNDGISTLQFKKSGETSYTAIPLSQAQWAYRNSGRKIPNKIIYCPEGDIVKIESVLPLWSYTATVTMVSTGISTDLDSILHLPEDYFKPIVEYIKLQLAFERAQKQDVSNDGSDAP